LLKIIRQYEKPIKGRLSVVYDQAGKARIVAITNWWIQLGFKPLHNSIFKVLRGLEEDGTFDQLAPLKRLFERVPEGQVYHSFDLSAATDRLPIEIQKDILNIITPFGNE
jgi:hypothetical protein